MNSTIFAAIITGLFAVFSPIVTLFIKQYLDNRSKLLLSTDRRQAISGRWEGDVVQYIGPDGQEIKFPITLKLQAGRKTVSGTLETVYESETQTDRSFFDVTGAFYYSRFLLLNYLPKNKSAIQFGSIVVELDDAGNILKGKFVGYGKLTQAVVSGKGILRKI